MNKIYVPPVILFLVGMIATIIGALFKITHYPGANLLLFIGSLAEVVGIILLIICLIKNSK